MEFMCSPRGTGTVVLVISCGRIVALRRDRAYQRRAIFRSTGTKNDQLLDRPRHRCDTRKVTAFPLNVIHELTRPAE